MEKELIKELITGVCGYRRKDYPFDIEWEAYLDTILQCEYYLDDANSFEELKDSLGDLEVDISELSSPTWNLMVRTGIIANSPDRAYNDFIDIIASIEKRFG